MDGIILVDKPSGCTSHDVVRAVKRKLKTKKVGHAGTLDPLASGLLIILVGQGTKLSDYLLAGEKGYRAKIRLGRVTDTQDITGKVLSECAPTVSPQAVYDSVTELTGEIELPIPDYSAVKVQGKKLYEYARQGLEVPQLFRTWNFYDVQVNEIGQDFVDVSLKCSKGGYIRAWASRLGELLGVGGCVAELRRDWSAPFLLNQAVKLSDLENSEDPLQWLIQMEDSLPDVEIVELSPFEEKLFQNGQVGKELSSKLLQKSVHFLREDQLFQVISSNDCRLLGLIRVVQATGVSLLRVFPRV